MRWPQWFKKVRNIFFSLLAVVLILLACLSALVETETGSRWLITRIAALVDANVQGVNGNLRSGLDIDLLEYRTADQAYRAEKLSFRWRPVDLLYGALVIQSLRAQAVSITLPAAQDSSTAPTPFNQWPHLRLPVRIHLQKARINNIEFVQGDARQHWRRLGGSVSWGTFNLRYDNLALVNDQYSVHLTGVTELDFPYKTQASLQWQWQAAAENSAATLNPPVQNVPAAPELIYMGVSEISGDLKKLQVSTQMGAPVVLTANVVGSLVNANNELQLAPFLQVQAQWQQQTLPAEWWVPGQPVPITNGKLVAEGNWKKYTAELHGDIYLPQAPILGVSAAAEGDLEQIRIDFLRLRERYISSVGVVAAAPVASSSATISAAIPETIAAPGVATDSPQIIDTDAGLTVQGSVRWLPQVDWQLGVKAEHLNIASLFDNWPSNINASFTTSGVQGADGWAMQLQNLTIDGDLRGVNIQGGGSTDYAGEKMRSDDLHLVLGANQIRVKGELGKQFNLDWNINAPMLAQIDNSVRGSVISRGSLRGTAQQPQMNIEAAVQQFSWGSYAVEKLQFSLTPTAETTVTDETTAAVGPMPADTNIPPAIDTTVNLAEALRHNNYALSFSANQLRVAENRFTSITLNGAGAINKHQLQAVIKHKTYGRADVKIAGDYESGEWQGRFEQLALKLKKVPRWWLTSSNKMRITADSVSLGRQCLTTRTNLTGQVEKIAAVEQEQVIGEWVANQNYVKPNYEWLLKSQALPMSQVEKYSLPQLCVEGEWSANAGAQLHANLDSVPLRQFLSLFKTEVYFAGVMDGAVHIRSDDLTLAGTKASANIATRNAELRYQYVGGATDVYAWRNFFVRATLADSTLTANAGMDWTGYGRIDANSEMDLLQQTFTKGKLTAFFSNLAPLETLLPFANDVQGDLRTDLSLSGSFAQPQLIGEMSLRNGSAKLPRLGIDLSNVEIQLNSTQAGTVNLVSQVQSGEGRLSIVSDLRGLGTRDWNLQGFVNGNNVQVVALPQLKATLSPNIKVVAAPGTLELTGTATIPWARTNIKSLPESATAVSADTVIVDEQFLQDNTEEKLKVLTNLELVLGDDVRFKGFGLNSKLTGNIKLFKEAQRQFFTSGYVSVVDGTYKAYGQTLTVERGRLNFQGPYENPGLDIRASRIIRDDENTKVGLDVSGTLQRPKASVFSSEKLSESQAMMMLLTGKPLDEASKADASLLISAMSGLGMDSDGSITTEITRIFRVDELEIKSDQGFNQSELWVGKYLTPKLLVRYVVGIFDQAFGFGVEYQLTNRLRLEAVSGETQSVDVVYKVEK